MRNFIPTAPPTTRAAMLNQLMTLPYVEYWLPAVVGGGVIGLLYLLLRPSRKLAAVPAEGETVEGVTPFAALVATATKSSEQRRSFRRGGNPVHVYYKRGASKENPSEGWVVDRSMGGFCLMTHEEIPNGTVLSILPVKAIELIPWVDVEVRSCRLGEDSYEVGCQFVKSPPYSILLLFG